MAENYTRRQILSGTVLAAAAGAACGANPFSALASITVNSSDSAAESDRDTLVVIFLRGGADGLNIVPPCFEDDYYRLRPSLALARPTDRRASAAGRALDLDGKFALHPALGRILPLFRDGQLAVVHAVGSGDQTRSHFEAMTTMERGNARNSGASSGWIARHLLSTAKDIEPPLRAVAVTETMPESLRGATSAAALLSLADYRLVAFAPGASKNTSTGQAESHERTAAVTETLRAMYGTPRDKKDLLLSAGNETLQALDAVKRLDPVNYRPSPGVAYPKEELGTGLRQAACMIKGNIGLEVACLDLYGWDTHITQGRETGLQASRLAELGGSLASFVADLGKSWLSKVCIIVMTEFGRRAYENSGLGTDHGRGSCMLVLGGGINGGKVYANWPGLSAEKLEDGGDLRVTTDYRGVLAEVLTHRLKSRHVAEVFPDFNAPEHGIAKIN